MIIIARFLQDAYRFSDLARGAVGAGECPFSGVSGCGANPFLPQGGIDKNFGARPLRRAIQRYIEDELSEMILRSQLLDGQTVKVDFENDKLKFEVK